MKQLGMIGGTSWHSTIEYYRYINAMVGEKLGSHLNPPLLLYSLNLELMRRGDWEEIEAVFLRTSQLLERAGAEALIFCANTPHRVYADIAPKVEIPILHIADAIGEEAKRLGLGTLGLIGTKYVMRGRFIPDRLLEHHQVQTVVPQASDAAIIHRIIADELTKGIFSAETKAMLVGQMDKLRAQGAEGIILGCTEFPLILRAEDYDLPLLNTTRLHAAKAVSFITS